MVHTQKQSYYWKQSYTRSNHILEAIIYWKQSYTGSNPILVLGTRLHRVFAQELGQKYVIIVGDAKTSKTYNTLQEICHEYKSQLKWLTPFPCDWQVLYNSQKALMKPYKDAGLASLGKVSGHRTETLTSLLMIQASNFWQTHEFLPQAYEVFYR